MTTPSRSASPSIRWLAAGVGAASLVVVGVTVAGSTPWLLLPLLVVVAVVALLLPGRQPAPQPAPEPPVAMPVANPFTEKADELFARHDGNPAVVVLDVAAFRDVRTVLGDQRADDVLDQVAARIGEVAGQWPMGHLGGERFGVAMMAQPFLPAHHIGRQVQDKIAEPLTVGGVTLRLRTAVGVALGDDDADTLVKRAGLAAGTEQARNEGLSIYQPEEPEVVHRRLAVLTGLSNALDDPAAHEFGPAFQPIVDVTGALVSAEALSRWDDPVLGPVSPAEFIPLAEQTGMVRPLFSHILQASLEACAAWRDGGVDAGVSVNVSPLNLADPVFHSELTSRVERTGVDPRVITLEVTESAVLEDQGGAVRTLRDLRRIGFEVALDDFGIGQSSLARLRELPVSMVKLDKFFISGLLTDTRAAGIIKATVEVCHLLGMKVVAEGVEVDEQADRLIEMGVERLQGYLFSKAITVTDIVSGPIIPSDPTKGVG